MIASRTGLAVLTALAIVLAVMVVFDRGERAPGDRALIPGLDVEHIAQLEWTRPGEPAVRLTRDTQGWRWGTPAGRADPAAIDAVLTALRGGHWHRHAARELAGEPRATVMVDGVALAIGAPLPGSQQTWIARAHDAVLVDDWVATALAPSPLGLRVREPFARAAAARDIETSTGVRLVGRPLRVTAPRTLLLAPTVASQLEDALAAIEIVALPTSGTAAGSGVALRVDNVTLTADGECRGGRVLVRVASGDGCVEAASWERALALLSQCAGGPADAVVDPRPAAIDAVKLRLADGALLDRTARPRLNDRAADPERIAELLHALADPAMPVASSTATTTATIGVTDRNGTSIELELHGDRTLARHGEPISLRPSPEAWAVLTRPSAQIVDATRWLEEPTTIAAITVDGRTFSRGAVIGEWTGAQDSELVEALASALATMRAPAGPVPAHVEHHIELVIEPPSGARVTHRIEVGGATAGGCPAKIDGEGAQVSLATCTAIVAVSASPPVSRGPSYR